MKFPQNGQKSISGLKDSPYEAHSPETLTVVVTSLSGLGNISLVTSTNGEDILSSKFSEFSIPNYPEIEILIVIDVYLFHLNPQYFQFLQAEFASSVISFDVSTI